MVDNLPETAQQGCRNRFVVIPCRLVLDSDSKWKGQISRLAILQSFLAIFCKLHYYISQNLGAESYFEGLNMSKFQLDQNLWYQSQIVLTSACFNFWRKIWKFQKRTCWDHFWSLFLGTNKHTSQNWDLNSHFEVLSM